MTAYRLFGYTLRTAHAFETPMLGVTDPGALVSSEPSIRLDLRFGPAPEAPATRPVYETAHDADPPALRVFETASGGYHLRFAEGLAVGCEPGEIDAVAPDDNALSWAEIRLLGPVFAFYLERAGLPVLHASAVDLGDRAVAFLAGNRAGKSSLAAALVARGHALLTDDLLAVEPATTGFLGRPGYPQMRFWPDAARYWIGSEVGLKAGVGSAWRDLPRVHPTLEKRRLPVERFTPEPRPLTRIFLPERGEATTEIAVTPVRPREALLELIGRSFIPRLAAAAGWEARRFRTLARLAEAVPVARLVYPSGFERLPDVARAVEEILGESG